ncbi:Eukaryotic translation initiation factor isoform 4G-1 [Galdieria sulphuraria]|nr:Eukaryotic translation initiation factor isoform 4G-1 [Galdieria sulphuraria]
MHTENSQRVKQAGNQVEKKGFETLQESSVGIENFPNNQLAGGDSFSLTFGTFEEVTERDSETSGEEQNRDRKQISASLESVTRVDQCDEVARSPGTNLSSSRSQPLATPEEVKVSSSIQSAFRANSTQSVLKDGSSNIPQFNLGMHNIPKDMQRTSSAPPNPAEVGKLPPFLPDRFQHYVRNSYPYSGGNASYGQPLTSPLSVPLAYGAPTGQETSMFAQGVPQGVGYTVYGTNQPNSFVSQHSYVPYSSNSQTFETNQRQKSTQVSSVSSTGVVVPPKREKKRIPIIDPNTKQEIDLSSTALEKEKRRTSTTSSPQVSSKDPSESYQTIPSKQFAGEGSSSSSAQLEAKVPPYEKGDMGEPNRSTTTDEIGADSYKKSNLDFDLVTSENVEISSEHVVNVSSRQDQNETDNTFSTPSDGKSIVENTTSLHVDSSENSRENLKKDIDVSNTEVDLEQNAAPNMEKEQVTVSIQRDYSESKTDEELLSFCTTAELNNASIKREDTSQEGTVDRAGVTSPITGECRNDEQEEEVALTMKTRFRYPLEILEDLKSVGSLDSFDERTQDDIQFLPNLSSKSFQSKKHGSLDKFPKNVFPGSNISGPPPGFTTKSLSSKDSYDLGRARNRNVPVPGSNQASAKGRSFGGKELSDLRGTKVAAPDMRIIQAAQAWKHRRDDEDEFTRKIHTVRSILNKLTYEKFDRLYEQILDVKIDSPELLRGIVSEIFDKALLEPNFGPMYAELCDRLSVSMQKMLDESADGGFRDESGKKVTFKSILLSNCQSEFQKFAKCEAPLEKHQLASKDKEIPIDTNEKSDSNLFAEEEEERHKMKRRMIGNIKFIGELFKKDMISERVIRDDCIPRLLSLSLVPNPDDDDLESLCKLLTSVGAKLDSHVENRPMLDQYFQALEKFRATVKLPSRIRFMIMDLLDLRKNNWVERRQEAQAKTIGEIHADAQREERAKAQASRERMLSSRDRRTISAASYAPRMTMHMGTSSPRSPGVSQRVEANWEKFGAKKPDWREYAEKVELGPVRLGPSSAILSMAGGARGWKTESGTSDIRRTEAHSNNTTESRPKSILTHSTNVLGETAEGSSTNVGVVREEELETGLSTEPEALTQEAFSRRLKSILEEYHSLKDAKEAEESLKEIPKSNMENFVFQFVQVALESKTSVRNDAITVFSFAKETVAPDVIRNGFISVIEILDDLDIDDPHASDFVASLTGRAAAVGMLRNTNNESANYGLNFLQNSLTRVAVSY